MKVLYFDCSSGISGNMTLGALSELIDDPHYLVNELKKLNVDGYHIHISKEKKNGITGTYVDVHLEHEHHHEHEHEHEHEHLHHEHAHHHHHEQPCARQRPPVADHVLRRPLLADRPAPQDRLRQAGRRLRRTRLPCFQYRRAARRAAGSDEVYRSCADRRTDRQGRARSADDPGRRHG